MSSFHEAYNETLLRVKNLKEEGFVFNYKGIDLSDLLMSEITSIIRSEKLHQLPGNYSMLKFKLKLWIERSLFNTIGKLQRNAVLVLITSLNHWQNARAVVECLSEQNIPVQVITTKLPLARLIRNEGINVTYLKGMALSFKDIIFNKSNYSVKPIRQIIDRYLPMIRFLHEHMSHFLIRYNPRYLLIGNDLIYEGRLFGRLAMDLGIPTGSIQHGIISGLNPRQGESIVDQFFVYGEQSAKILKYLGKSEDNILLSGWPQKKSLDAEIKKCRQLDTWDSPFVAVTLSGPGHVTSLRHHDMIKELLIRLQKDNNLNLCIKLHPKDAPGNYRGFNPQKTLLMTNKDMSKNGFTYWGILKQSIFVITGSSASANDALLVSKPVLTIDLLNEYPDIDFIKDGLTLHSTTYRELDNNYRLLCSRNYEIDQVRRESVDRYYYGYSVENFDPARFIAEKIVERCVE